MYEALSPVQGTQHTHTHREKEISISSMVINERGIFHPFIHLSILLKEHLEIFLVIMLYQETRDYAAMS